MNAEVFLLRVVMQSRARTIDTRSSRSQMSFKILFLKLKIKRQRDLSKKTYFFVWDYVSQPAVTCSKLTIEALKQGVKYV